MAPLKCCVGGCNATSDSHRLFSVPKDANLRSLWMNFLVPTNPLLIGLTTEQLLRKRVCQKHFERRQLDGQGRRTRYSYPCLFTEKEIAHGMPLSSEEYHVLTEHNYHQLHEDNDNDDNAETLLVIGKADDNEHLYEHSYASCSSAIPSCHVETHISSPSLASSISAQTQKDGGPHLHKDVYPSCLSEIPSCAYGETGSKMATSSNSMQKQKGSSITKKPHNKKRKFIRKENRKSTITLAKDSFQGLNYDSQKLSGNSKLLKNFDALSKHAKTLLTMQLKLAGKNKMARRFDMDEKLIALTLMKQSPKGYKLLEKMFVLPTKRTLNRLSEKICFEPGINQKVLKYLQEVTKTWERKKKLCTILFDEVALTPHLTFNETKDTIDGFVELGRDRKLRYCDHALVFMIRGICSPWRQSIAFYFSEGTVSTTELVQILKDIISQVAQTGLVPLGLVCDQGSTFRSAFHSIRKQTIRSRDAQGVRDDGTIEIAGLDLNVFFDPPHLLKSIRNNFLTKDIIFDGKVGSWKDIMFIFDIDSKLGHTRALPKLTAHHVIPNKIKKMKVSAATQVLSARTAAMLKYTNALDIRNSKGCTENTTMATTAEVVEFFDNLFDSINGSPGSTKRGKLRSPVKVNSPHVEFWQQAIQKLKNIKFRDYSSKRAIQAGQPRILRVPCLDGWITTLESFLRMTKLLLTEYGVEYYYPRYVNQDPLENFFGRIRALNYRNVNPDAHTFICSFKALILSNLLSPHSRFCNCEEDDGETLIKLNFLFEDTESDKENIPQLSYSIPSSSSQESDQDLITQVFMEKMRVQCSAYTAGYLCRKITKQINCNMCLKTYTTNEIDSIHKFIQYREYKSLKRNNLAYPNENFLRLYRETAQYIHSYLNIHCHEKNIGKNIRNILCQNLHYTWLGCKKHHHDVIKIFFKIAIRMQVHNWCNIINKIFKGDVQQKYAMKMKEPQKMAYRKYEKIRFKKKCIDKIKNIKD